LKDHEINFMGRKVEAIAMGRCDNCEARFINNRNNGSYTIIFKYNKMKDCKNYSRPLLEKINEIKDAYEGNREITIDEGWHSIAITNAVDNGIDMTIYMNNFDLMLELDYISYISEEGEAENGNTKRSE